MSDAAAEAKQGKLHTLWRIVLVRLFVFFSVTIAAYGCVQIALTVLFKYVPKPYAFLAGFPATLLACLLMLGVYVYFVHRLERRKVSELSLSRGAPLVTAGAVLAFVLFCIAYGIFWELGLAQWKGFVGFNGVALLLAISAISGVGEELIFRGGVFRVLEGSFGTAVALILSGALFGGLHLLNHNATLFGAVAIALEAGVLLGAAYSATRNLWFPIGLHFGWNFSEGGVFGAAVSGGQGGKGIFSVPLSGPDLLTGGTFGPEASVVTLAVCLFAGIVLVVLTIRNGRWVPLSFKMMLD